MLDRIETPDDANMSSPAVTDDVVAPHKGSLRSRPLIRSPWMYFLVVTLFDGILAALAVQGAVRWRYDFLNRSIPNNVEEVAALVTFVLCIVVWAVMRVPRAIWRFTSLDDIKKLFQAVVIVMALLPLTMYLFVNAGTGFPRSVPIIAGPLLFLMLVASRLLILVFRNGDVSAVFRRSSRERRDAILVGTGEALSNTLRDIGRSAQGWNLNAVGLFTTDESQIGRSIRGVPVVGTQSAIADIYPGLAQKYDDPPQLIAVDPNPPRESAAALIRTAAEIGAPLSRLAPGVTGILTPFEAQDLIGRSARSLDMDPVCRLIAGRTVLITGAGGSIGSELVRQVAALDPASLVLVDHSEFNLYSIDRELKDTSGHDLEWTACLGDVTDLTRMDEIFSRHRPDLVLHAAALKHVPLGERNPLQTLFTNVEGTRIMLELCVAHNVPSFTLVSTDKAVNTHNIMGASKAIAEMLTHAYNRRHETLAACAVRFGNVLASAGSVIPLFEAQIARGGPVTVTHPDVTRYFMTTQEASALVLQATALNVTQRKSESSIYVLEMGEPVNIARLARQLVRLRGKVPDRDVEIIFTGLRDGETLDERIVGDPEALESTYVDGLLRISGSAYDAAGVPANVNALTKAVRDRDMGAIRTTLHTLLPAYTPNGTLSFGH